jgi:hypothetical protein
VVYEFAWILVLIAHVWGGWFSDTGYYRDQIKVRDVSFLSPTFFNSAGITCLVVSPAERERGGSTKLADAL